MRRLLVSRAGLTALASLTLAAGPVVAQDGPWVLTNARIVTVTRGVIERGSIVIRDGLIAAVGADVAAPADARVLDLAGRTVFPAFIDLTSSLGLAAAPTAAGARPGAPGEVDRDAARKLPRHHPRPRPD